MSDLTAEECEALLDALTDIEQDQPGFFVGVGYAEPLSLARKKLAIQYLQAHPREITERDKFYAEEQICGHGLRVRFGKGDWFHSPGDVISSICNVPPEPPPFKGESK